MAFEGTWDMILYTPIGKMNTVLRLTVSGGGLQGIMQQGGDAEELKELRLSGNRLTWSMSVKKPMRLNLKFDVAAQGDVLKGMAKAGLLPATKVEGLRRL